MTARKLDAPESREQLRAVHYPRYVNAVTGKPSPEVCACGQLFPCYTLKRLDELDAADSECEQ